MFGMAFYKHLFEIIVKLSASDISVWVSPVATEILCLVTSYAYLEPECYQHNLFVRKKYPKMQKCCNFFYKYFVLIMICNLVTQNL